MARRRRCLCDESMDRYAWTSEARLTPTQGESLPFATLMPSSNPILIQRNPVLLADLQGPLASELPETNVVSEVATFDNRPSSITHLTANFSIHQVDTVISCISALDPQEMTDAQETLFAASLQMPSVRRFAPSD